MKARKTLPKLELGTYLALAFSLLSLFLTLLLTVVVDLAVSRQIKSDIGSNLAQLAAQTANQLDRAMFERYREVGLIAQRFSRADATGTPQQRRGVLEALQQSYGYYAWIGLTDLQGRVLVATKGLLEGGDVSARPWFRNALNGIHAGDVHEAKLLAKLLPNPGNEPQRFVDVAFPYQGADGQVAGVLGAHISWAWANDIAESLLAPVVRERSVHLVIASADGQILLGPSGLQGKAAPAESAVGEPIGPHNGYGVTAWPDGRRYLTGYSRSMGYGGYPGLGWRVLVLQDMVQAYEPVRLVRQQVLWGGLGIGALFSLVALIAARTITRPLLRLSRAAQRIEAGEMAEIDSGRTAYTEVQVLSGSLNSLLNSLRGKEKDLRELNTTLEKRVEQRTSDLSWLLATVRENEHKVRTIVETAQGAFVGMDFDGQIVGWNTHAETILGWKRKDVIGRSLFETLIPPRFVRSSEAAFQKFLATEHAQFIDRRMERLVMTADGRELPVEMNIGLVNTPQMKFFSAFLYDISERKAVERMKDEFISTVSHELRTPLTGIYGSLSLLVSGMAGELPDDVRQLLVLSHQSAERLVRLINDVLDIEKIASNSMQYRFEVQPLRPLVEQAIAATQSFADPYQVRLVLNADASHAGARVDADRMVQVVVNLLSNAAKFSRAGGAVVEVGIAARDGQVRLSVVDHGTGIPKSFRDRIFERFAQVDASDRRQKGGTGLAIATCRSIVLAHGGTIGYESTAGGGTTFHVDLPEAQAGV